MQDKRIWIIRGDQAGSGNILAKPQEVCKKSKSENSYSSNDSLACHKRLRMAPDWLQYVRAFKTNDKQKRKRL